MGTANTCNPPSSDCNCWDKTPTVPVYRDRMDHLDGCPLKGGNLPVGSIRRGTVTAGVLAGHAPAPAAGRWQPIDSAPRDGTVVLGWAAELVHDDFNQDGIVEMFCCGDGEPWIGAVWNNGRDAWDTADVKPTHWRRRPKPPGAGHAPAPADVAGLGRLAEVAGTHTIPTVPGFYWCRGVVPYRDGKWELVICRRPCWIDPNCHDLEWVYIDGSGGTVITGGEWLGPLTPALARRGRDAGEAGRDECDQLRERLRRLTEAAMPLQLWLEARRWVANESVLASVPISPQERNGHDMTFGELRNILAALVPATEAGRG